MKKIIELIIVLVVVAGIGVGLYYGIPYLYDYKKSHILDEDMCSITCSSDGRIVYILEPGRLIKSTDGGKNWKIVEVEVK